MQDYTFPQPEGGDIDKGWAILAVCWSFVLCAFITTALRIWVRLRLTKNFGSDDAVMVVAMGTTVIGAVLVTLMVINGLGRHQYYLEASQKRMFQALGWGDWIQSFITLALTKISICLFLKRIVDSSRVKFFIWGLITFLVLFTAICSFFFLGVCRPLKAYWDVGVTGVCLSDIQIRNVVIAQGVLSIVTDLICAGFPILFLRNLQIRSRTKIGLCILMGLGLITVACCTVRTAISYAVTEKDITWAITSNVGWRLPEVNIGIVCANIPMLRPIYLFYRGRLQSAEQSKRTKSYSHSGWGSGSSKPLGRMGPIPVHTSIDVNSRRLSSLASPKSTDSSVEMKWPLTHLEENLPIGKQPEP